ncbi:MAG: two-component sensor histidine kinase [Crocinitomicaceae bacterium]|jgi:two-component sensor histidine kinase
MTHSFNRFCIFFTCILAHSFVIGQVLEKEHYLVDSLSKKDLSKFDMEHIDSLIPKFHSSKSISNKLDAIDKILAGTPNNILSEKYSDFLIDYTSNRLNKKSTTSGDRKILKKYQGIGYNYKGLSLGRVGQEKMAKELYHKSLRLFEEVDFKVGLGYAYNNLGARFHKEGNLDSCLFYYNKGLDINIILDEKMGIASLQYNMAAVLETQGKIVEAVKLYHKAIRVFEEIDNVVGVAYTYNNLAAISFVLDDYDKAIEYQIKSMEVFKGINDQSAISYCLNNLGAMYREKGDLNKAFTFLNKSLGIRKTIKNKVGIIDCLNNIALIHVARGESELAYKKLIQALSICREVESAEELCNTLKNLGSIDIELKRWELAKERLDSALVIAQEIENVGVIKESAKYLMEIAEHSKNWQRAFSMQTLYHSMRDSTRNDDARNAVVLGEMTYNHEKEILAKNLQDEERSKIKQLEYKQSIKEANTFMLFGIVGAVLMLLLAAVLFFGYKRKNKMNLTLSEKNEENELLLGEIHHRVKNNLQVISSLLALQERSITDEKAKAAIIDGRERVQSIGLIHKHLYQSNNFSSIEMQSYISNLIQGLIATLGDASNPIKIELDIEKNNVDIDNAVPLGLMINELVVNAIKHAFVNVESPVLKVSNKEEEGKVIWEISDNGNGKKVDVEESRSFGMKLIRSLTRQLGGDYQIVEENGLIFSIILKPNLK